MARLKVNTFKPQIYEDMAEVNEDQEDAPSSAGNKKKKRGTPHNETQGKNRNSASSGRKRKSMGSNKRQKTTKGARGAGSKGKPKGKAFSLFSSMQNDGQLIMPQLKTGDENAENASQIV